MRRALAPAAVALLAIAIAIAIGIGASVGSGSAPSPAITFVTGSGGSPPTVWIADGSGGARRKLGTGAQPLLSPDGSIVATSSVGDRGPALTLYSTSGAPPRRFFNLADATALAQSWSPDSRYLAVVLASTNPGSDAASALAVIDARTSAATVVARGTIYGAGFAPDATHRIAYASARAAALDAPVDVHVIGADGSGAVQITHDGRSLDPVWGHSAIVFDRERLRPQAAPAYQLWSMHPDGTNPIELTQLPIGPLLSGLVPIGISDDGTRLLAEFEGQDISQAWAIDIAAHRARRVLLAGQGVVGAAIARNGSTLLVDRGGFLDPPDAGVAESVPFGGGPARVLVAHGSGPSWNF